MIGIYKITSPSKKVYIGQSVNIEKRFSDYKNLRNVNEQPKLYNSFLKYGVEKHKFEVIEECEINELNDNERYYQDLYNVISFGLNCVLTNTKDKNGFLSDDVKLRISLSRKGKGLGIPKTEKFTQEITKRNKSIIWKQESRDKISESAKKRKGNLNPFFGKKHSEETKLKISLSRKNNKYRLGKKHTQETKDKIKLSVSGNFYGLNNNAKLVLDLNTGVFYSCVKELADLLSLNKVTLAKKIRTNKTQYIYA